MANVYFSYVPTDEELAKKIADLLGERGHTFICEVGKAPVGNESEVRRAALRESEVLIPLLSQAGRDSRHVAIEIGFAQALRDTRGMLLLPVGVGAGDPLKDPELIGDDYCFPLPNDDDAQLVLLADKLDQAILDLRTPRIFVSHWTNDEPVVRAMLELLEAAFEVNENDIRCTSVEPYTLDTGSRVSEQLRLEISRAQVVLGVLSRDTKDSQYVLAELGASWGQDIPTFPLLVRGVKPTDVPEPLRERHSMSLEEAGNGRRLVDEIARVSSLRQKQHVSAVVEQKAQELARISRIRGES